MIIRSMDHVSKVANTLINNVDKLSWQTKDQAVYHIFRESASTRLCITEER